MSTRGNVVEAIAREIRTTKGLNALEYEMIDRMAARYANAALLALEEGKKARYEHDCESCTFVGVFGNYDLYTCPQGDPPHPTVVARYGDEGQEYMSGSKLEVSGCFGTRAVFAELRTGIDC